MDPHEFPVKEKEPPTWI